MKMTIEVDCTPEEARRFMGLPDVSGLNDHLVGEMTKRIDATSSLTFAAGSKPPLPGFAPCDSLISIIFTLGNTALSLNAS